MYSKKQITLDLEEFNAINSELEGYKLANAVGGLTQEELQEATAMLLIRALENPGLFRTVIDFLDLGKYKAIFVRQVTNNRDKPKLLVKFEKK